MGEPVAKPMLILLGLCVERIALAEYLKVPINAPLGNIPSWRVFHLGGDDHIAVGPKEYLNGISDNHRLVGGIPSEGKHGLSKVAVAYTEKLLYFKDMVINLSPSIADQRYSETIFIDSIKIKNLSPFRKGSERENEVSSYIGKCKAVSRSIGYLKDSMKLKGRIAISRLKYRFNQYLPSNNQRTMSAVVAMPEPLGGLGLTVNLERSAENLPVIFRKAYKAILDGKDTRLKIRRALSSMWKPQMKRGIEVDNFCAEAEDQILWLFDKIPKEDVVQKYDPDGDKLTFAAVIYRAKKDKIYPIDSVRELIEKPYIIRRLLQGKATSDSLKVAPIKHRLRRCWDLLETFDEVNSSEPIRTEDIFKAEKEARKAYFIDLNTMTTEFIDENGDAVDTTSDTVDWEKAHPVDVSLYDMLMKGMPNLDVTL